MILMDDIHADVVEANFVVSRVWENIGFVFSAPLRTVKFAGVFVTIPSTAFTERVLTKQFGANWMYRHGVSRTRFVDANGRE